MVPDLEKKNDSSEPNGADHVHAEVEAGKDASLSSNHEEVTCEHVHFPLFDGFASVPFSIGLSKLDQYALVNHEDRKQEKRNTDIGVRILPCHTEASILPNVEASSEINEVQQDACNGMNPEELTPEHATQVAVGHNHD